MKKCSFNEFCDFYLGYFDNTNGNKKVSERVVKFAYYVYCFMNRVEFSLSRKKKYVNVSISKVDDNLVETTISSPHSVAVRCFSNISDENLEKVIKDYILTENKGKTRKLNKIPIYRKNY